MNTSLRAAAAAFTAILSASVAESQCLVTKLTADDAQRENQFGRSVAIQGNEIFVGSPMENLAAKDSGSVHVLRRQGLGWFLKAKLTPPDARERLGFGTNIAVDQNTLVVASSRSAPALYVYEKTGTTWNLAQTLPGPSATLDTLFACSLAVRGDWIFAGAPQESTAGNWAGSVFLYQRTDAGWVPAGNLAAADLDDDDQFGTYLDAWGDQLVVGAPRADDGGAAYVFERSGDAWVERQKLAGEPLAQLGSGIALRDGLLAALTATDARLFEEVGGSWTQVATLTMPQPAEPFVRSVALSREHVLVTADTYYESNLFTFRRGNAEWSEVKRLQPLDVANGSYRDYFAWNIAASGDLVVANAFNSSQRAAGAGAVYVYDMSETSCATLSSPRELSWGKQRLEIDRGPEHAGHFYRMLGSISGTSRGIPVRGMRLPLNLDAYFIALLRTPHLSLFPTTGILDGNGRASLLLRVPPEAYPFIQGLTLDHAFIEVSPAGLEHVSNAVQVRFGARK